MSKKEFYKNIFSFFKKQKLQIILFFVLGLFSLVFGMIEPFFSAKLLQAITNVTPKEILILSSILLGIGVLEQIFSYIRNEQGTNLREKITLDTQAFVAKELFFLEQKNFDEKGTSFFSSRVNSDSRVTAQILSRVDYRVTSTLKSAGVLIYIFILSIPIGIYFVISSVFLFLIRLKGIKVREKQRKEEDDKQEIYNSSFVEIIRGIRDIKVLNLKEKMISKTLKDQNNLNILNRKNRKKMYIYDEVRWLLRSVLDFGIFVFAIYLLSKHLFLGANLIILYTYKNQAFNFLDSLFYLYEDIVDIKYSFNRLYEIMDGKTYSKESYGNKHIKKVKGDIEFRNVSFGYKEEKILKGISFHIKPNDTVGFVGKSGAGKSTIFSLIPKLYEKNEGDILLDGISINELDEQTIRENIAVITQNPYLFNMTIRDNLKIVKPNATDSEMIKNCKLVRFMIML